MYVYLMSHLTCYINSYICLRNIFMKPPPQKPQTDLSASIVLIQSDLFLHKCIELVVFALLPIIDIMCVYVYIYIYKRGEWECTIDK